MHLAHPRHVRPVLGSYLRARSKHELKFESDREERVAVEVLDVPPIPAPPTVGRAWELDTFTAPSRGRELKAKEKFGLVVFAIGLVMAGAFMLWPARLHDETVAFRRLAGTGILIEDAKPQDFARAFLQTLGGEGWSLGALFRNVPSSFWPESAAAANAIVAHYAEGFETLREHGRLLGVDFTPGRTSPEDPAGSGGLRIVPCTLELADGTAFRASVQLAAVAGGHRWSVVKVSVDPIVP